MGTDGIPKALVSNRGGTTINIPVPGHSDEITGLEFNKICIIQQRCEKPQTREDGTAGAIRVYAGRDCYVWPGLLQIREEPSVFRLMV